MRWRSDRVLWAAAGLTALALALRLAHVLTSAKLLVADDAVFFVQHASAFTGVWRAIGQPEFGALMRDAVDHASLQGVVYPLFLSAIYALRGGIDHTAVALVQAALGAATVWLVFLTARRAFGDVAAIGAGLVAAVYPPLILTSGLLLAEGVLLFVQALAGYLLVARRGVGAGLSVGVLMLRPAFQHAGLLTLMGLIASRPGWQVLARYVAGLLVIAVPWLTVNGVVYGKPVWSRTGDAWQQVYWGIYPPNRGWWPPDSPVPPKYGVDSLPGARAAGRVIEVRDLDYLEAAINQVRATPLQALATEANKLAHGYLYPFNTYGEAPPLVAWLAAPLHRGIAWLALIGAALAVARRAATALALGGLAAGVSLPFLVSHIDVRYVVPIALAALPFVGYAIDALLARARAVAAPRDVLAPATAVGVLVVAAGTSVPLLTTPLSIAPALAQLFHNVVLCGALVAAAWLIGSWLRAALPFFAAGMLVTVLYASHALYDPEWHQWSTRLRPGELAVQRIGVPGADQLRPGAARAEVRIYAAGPPQQSYVPRLLLNGREVARLGPAFTEGGPLRFEERVMLAASRQGKSRAEVPQWYGVPLDLATLTGEPLELALTLDGAPGDWIRVWGDYPGELRGHNRIETPAIHSRIQGQDDSFQKFVATGHGRLWRRHELSSSSTRAWLERGGRQVSDDLSDSVGRQTGTFRMRLLVFTASGELLSIY